VNRYLLLWADRSDGDFRWLDEYSWVLVIDRRNATPLDKRQVDTLLGLGGRLGLSARFYGVEEA
jgi:hypothetical protein